MIVRNQQHVSRRGEEALAEKRIRQRLADYTPSLLPLTRQLALAAKHDVLALFTGETGTGKTTLARLIHESSPRCDQPFVTVSCGALSANLVESAFFGHVKGAFTGADRDQAGRFAAAREGSILLDEIDALGLEHQAALLRVIETGEYEPVGGEKTHRCRARILVASNWDLEKAVAQGRFREDLYYRLNVMSFHLPPLRERPEDIGPLVRGFLAHYAARFRKPMHEVSPEAETLLKTRPWPGNLRELENAIQQAVLCGEGSTLRPEHLPGGVWNRRALETCTTAVPPAASLDSQWQQQERLAIHEALVKHDYHRTHTAQALGISRVTLYKKMKLYGLQDLGPASDPCAEALRTLWSVALDREPTGAAG